MAYNQPLSNVVYQQQPFGSQGPSNECPPGSDPNAEVQIRNCTEADAEFAAKMTVESFRDKFEWAVGKSRIQGMINAETDHHRIIKDQYNDIFIATVGGIPAGLLQLKYNNSGESSSLPASTYCHHLGCCGSCGLFCMVCALSESPADGGTCYIDHICVDESFRGKGIGKLLMDRCDYEARKHRCYRVHLFVAQSNRAKNLYTRHGYKVIDDEDGCFVTWCTVGVRYWYKMEKRL